jgi:hypothetical protein
MELAKKVTRYRVTSENNRNNATFEWGNKWAEVNKNKTELIENRGGEKVFEISRRIGKTESRL